MRPLQILTGSTVAVGLALMAATASAQPLATGKKAGTTVTVEAPGGGIKEGKNELKLTFTDASGKPIAVQDPAMALTMPAMGSMAAMKDTATLTPAGPGAYQAAVDVEMNGTWQGQVTWTQAGKKHRWSFSTTTK